LLCFLFPFSLAGFRFFFSCASYLVFIVCQLQPFRLPLSPPLFSQNRAAFTTRFLHFPSPPLHTPFRCLECVFPTRRIIFPFSFFHNLIHSPFSPPLHHDGFLFVPRRSLLIFLPLRIWASFWQLTRCPHFPPTSFLFSRSPSFAHSQGVYRDPPPLGFFSPFGPLFAELSTFFVQGQFFVLAAEICHQSFPSGVKETPGWCLL